MLPFQASQSPPLYDTGRGRQQFDLTHDFRNAAAWLLHLRQRADLGQQGLGQLAVDLDQRHRIASGCIAADMKGRDIDAGLAKRRGEFADEAWLVEIGDVDHRGAEFGVHADALDVDDARPAIGKHGPGDMPRLPLGGHLDRDQAFIVFRHFPRYLLDHDAALFCHHRCRHDIDLAEHRPQQTGERRRGERLGVHLRYSAFVGDLHLADTGFGQLTGEGAELLGQSDERLELWCLFSADGREVDGIGDSAAQKIVRHLLGNLQCHVFLRLRSGRTKMRRTHHVREAE